MMPRNAFMIGERLELGLRHVAKVVEVHIIGAGARAIGRGRLIEGLASRFLAKRLDRLHLQRRLGQRVEEGGQARFHRLHMRIDLGEIGVARLMEILRTGAQMDKELRSEEHTSDLQSLMRISYDDFCLKKKK